MKQNQSELTDGAGSAAEQPVRRPLLAVIGLVLFACVAGAIYFITKDKAAPPVPVETATPALSRDEAPVRTAAPAVVAEPKPVETTAVVQPPVAPVTMP